MDAGLCVRGLQIDYDEEVEFAGVQKLYDLARFNNDRPFMLWVSFTHPHSPFITTRRYWDLYDHDAVDMPAVPPIDVEEMDVMSRWLFHAHGGDLHDVTGEHVRNARHAYYGMCSYIDDKLGRLLDTLADLGIEDDTAVVFTSDHGEMLGERGQWFKQSFHEWSARVPLIVRLPGLQPVPRVAELVSLVDLLPTFLDVATQGDVPELVTPVDGRSLVPLMRGQAEWRNQVVSEYTGEGVCAPCRMVRRDGVKFIYTHGHPDLMYDLDADPLELHNLIGQHGYAGIEGELRGKSSATGTRSGSTTPASKARRNACSSTRPPAASRTTPMNTGPGWARFVRNASAVGTKPGPATLRGADSFHSVSPKLRRGRGAGAARPVVRAGRRRRLLRSLVSRS